MSSPEEFHKPGFDARVLFYQELVVPALKLANQSFLEGNVKSYFDSLVCVHAYVRPYIQGDLRADLQKSIEVLRNRLGTRVDLRFRPVFDSKTLIMLNELHKGILMASKHLLLPVGDDGDEDIDWDEIRRRGRT